MTRMIKIISSQSDCPQLTAWISVKVLYHRSDDHFRPFGSVLVANFYSCSQQTIHGQKFLARDFAGHCFIRSYPIKSRTERKGRLELKVKEASSWIHLCGVCGKWLQMSSPTLFSFEKTNNNQRFIDFVLYRRVNRDV